MTWKQRVPNIQPGDTVRLSGEFPNQIQVHTGDLPQMRGVVQELLDGAIPRAAVLWEGETEAKHYGLKCLEKCRGRGR